MVAATMDAGVEGGTACVWTGPCPSRAFTAAVITGVYVLVVAALLFTCKTKSEDFVRPKVGMNRPPATCMA